MSSAEMLCDDGHDSSCIVVTNLSPMKFTLWSSGSNAQGQLAHGNKDDAHNFRPCSFVGCAPGTMPPLNIRVLQVTSGANHTIVLLESTGHSGVQMWAAGDGRSGQLGAIYQQTIEAGASSTIFRPITLPLQGELSGYEPKFVATSWETTYIVLSREGCNDVLISMGSNDYGDLGVGTQDGQKKKTSPFHVVSFDHLTLLDGTPLNNASIVVLSLAAGQHHVAVQLEVSWPNKSSRRCVVGWGSSRHGQLGNVVDERGRPVPYISTPRIIVEEDYSDIIVAAALGNHHTVFLRVSGSILTFGSNRKGQLEDLQNVRQCTKLDCTWNGTCIQTKDNNFAHGLLSTGSNSHGQLGRQSVEGSPSSLAPVKLPTANNSEILALACGTEHALVLLGRGQDVCESSEVWGWGWNEHGNLGIGTTEDATTPVQLWPPTLAQEESEYGSAIGIWAGSGTSWIVTATQNEP
ncbi:hypothetical protein H0H93_013511 [Arthromyces matolae]|nr:hypothetical protein H0H93_013511 [Arthromyces matolae]